MKNRNIVIGFPGTVAIQNQDIELVERKGIGHPDSICDGIAESMSRELSREYIKRFGRVLHHNTDQVELVGGVTKPEFGGGEIIQPVYILLSGRATTTCTGDTVGDTANGTSGNENIPVEDIVFGAARNYLKDTIKNIDMNSDTHVEMEQKLGQGSTDLCHVFGRDGIPKSNDTSFGVGFAPFSTTEMLVLETERYINGDLNLKEVGEDVKVMGVRNKDEITLTVASAMVSGHIPDLDHYISTIEEMHTRLGDFVSKLTDKTVRIHINVADDYKTKSVYLTVTGTSAEQGDDGSVGRGNRANGLITPYRPMSLEATAGKNPINHVGKLYNLLSNKIAKDIADEGAEEVCVRILSQIGKPIDHPLLATVQLIGDRSLENRAREITNSWLENITDITKMCVEGKIDTF